ncbi:hypothetical protein ACFO1B_48840 [Dactylosporangium siamense]|uniref:PBP domain-containing protein n=1 Tax=Dactylosporangium siamense TaxID=685454 RepID=A0A919Q0W6_9ACTN|nr:hypothetical protein [Dactylosporangium siamense]GIG52158.1 hypothetical protein Dsi01nite_101990 [Dactylosporangium siamense]
MFNVKKTIAALAAVPMATSLVAVALVAGPAAADPPPPTGASYCGSGSDTTQEVVQKLAGTLDSGLATPTPANRKFESWNATGSANITTNCAAGSFARPNGSGAGINALRFSLGLDAGGSVPANALSFARSSSKPSDTSNTDLTWIPFGTDAVDFAFKTNGPIDQKYPTGLSKADLRSIFNCDAAWRTFTIGGTTYTFQPYVPQANSGTRKFFLGTSALNIADSRVNTTCLRDTKVSNSASVQEHDGTVLTDPVVGATNYVEIIPFSIAQYIGQTNTAVTGQPDRRGSAELGVLDSVTPITGSGLSAEINTTWTTTNSGYTREVYNVFRTTKVTGAALDKHLEKLFVGTGSKVCASATTIKQYGFKVTANCGSTTLKGKR